MKCNRFKRVKVNRICCFVLQVESFETEKNKISQELKKLKLSSKETMEEMEEKHKSEITTLTKEHEFKMKDLQDEHNSKIKTLAKEIHQKLAEKDKSYEDSFSEAVGKYCMHFSDQHNIQSIY